MNARGKIVLTLLVLAILAFGLWKWWPSSFGGAQPAGTASTSTGARQSEPAAEEAAAPTPAELVETQREVPRLAPAGVYQAKDGVLDVEISEYAGYAGLIAANGGLAPNPSSVFAKHGFQVRLSVSEEESWSALNSGKLAASATTADVLAVYGKQFQIVVPAQIGFSRGADAVVVTSDVKRINQLKGRVLATSQFTEADFFIRYLSQEAGLPVHMLSDLSEKPDAESLNLVYCVDAFTAGDLFLAEVKAGRKRLSGCVTWDPKTTEVVEGSGGKARLLASNTNLLIVADVLVVNKGLAKEHPEWVAGLVDGLLQGNRMVRDEPEKHLDVVGKAFNWDKAKTRDSLSKVHLSNLPENQAFFSGAIDMAGSFGGIYQSAVYAYGGELLKDPVDAEHFQSLEALAKLAAAGTFADQKIAIAPIRSTSAAAVEGDPLLTKDIRFLFVANDDKLDPQYDAENGKNLEAIKSLLQVSPGSSVLLRGHVDNAKIEELRKEGEANFRQYSLRAVDLSKKRANEVKRVLVERFGTDVSRVDTIGRGWEEPVSTESAKNRRVEVQWFTLE